MKGYKIFFFAIFILILISGNIFTQTLDPNKKLTEYILDIWNTDNGLPQNSVQTIHQTKDRFIWITTQEGLVRFDGVNFKVFDKITYKEIKNNYVSAFYEGFDGKYYVGMIGGGLTVIDKTKLRNFVTDDGLCNEFVSYITGSKDGSIWLATNKGLSRFKDGKFKNYFMKDGLPSDIVTSLTYDQSNNLWVGTDNGLVLFDNGVKRIFTINDGLVGNSILYLYTDKNNRLWIGTKDGISIYENGFFTNLTTNNGLPDNAVNVIYQASNNIYWFGTTTGGLVRYNNGKIDVLNSKNGLPNDCIFSIIEDVEGSLWIGTNGGGLVRLREPKFLHFTTNEGLASNFNWTVFQDSKGGMWFGSNDKGVTYFTNGNFKIFNDQNGLPHNACRAIFEDSKGNIWLGTNGGIVKITNGKIAQKYTKANGLSNDAIRAIKEDKYGNIWIATNGGGINLIKSDGSLVVYTTANGLSNDYPKYFLEDRNGNFWIGTNKGLNKFINGTFKVYDLSNGDKEHSSSNIIRCMYEDDDGTIWIGTNGGGLVRFKNEKTKIIAAKDGLFDETIFVILKDGNNKFWMSCNKGIFSVDVKMLNDFCDGKINIIQCTSYGKADGMKTIECNGGSVPAGFKAKDGTLFFSTMMGAAYINPNKIRLNEVKPYVAITSINADDKLTIDNAGDEIKLVAGTNKIEINFAGLSFIMPSKVKFKYKLEGVDDDWIDAGNRRFAVYTNLSPGHYTFKVLACNNDGVWSEIPAEAKFYITPYFYQTIWFKLFVILAIGYAIYRFYLWKTMQHKKREEELKQQMEIINQAKKAAEESQKMLQIQMQETEKAKKLIEEEKEYLNDSVDKILKVVNTFANGDLTKKIYHEQQDEIGKLCESFNFALSQVAKLLKNVKENINQNADMSQKISVTTEEMSASVMDLRHQINQVSISIEEMVKSIEDNSKNIVQAAKLAKESGENSKESSKNIYELIDGMQKIATTVINSSNIIKGLGDSSQKIGEIVDVINDIADQTNLLALNAAIEAARAGEQGRGFAVVADEVRKLAEKTAKATKEIHQMIKTIQNEVHIAVDTILKGEKEVEEGSSLANFAAISIESIYNSTTKVADFIEQIAAASEEQAATIKTIYESAAQINTVAEETAQAINDIALSSVNVSHQSEKLKELIEEFKIENS